MRPVKAALQLTQVWRSICPDGQPYPVDCRKLAEALNIKVHGEAIDDKFEAQLRIRGKRRAIIYNENIREDGRKNFCICHEIGHHSCHSNRKEFLCTSADLNDIAPHPKNIEQEANLFAATILMPADDFREQIIGQPLTLATLSELASERYKTSLTASCMRLIELSPRVALGVAVVRDNVVLWWTRTDEMRWTGFGFRKGHILPSTTLTHNPNSEFVASDFWLNEKNSRRWTLTQSSVDMPYYNQTLFLIQAERNGDDDQYGDYEIETIGPTGTTMSHHYDK